MRGGGGLGGVTWPRVLGLLVAAVWGGLGLGCDRGPRARGVMTQDAYVWQRDWNAQVVGSVDAGRSSFRRLVVLGAEVTWKSAQLRLETVAFRVGRTNAGPVGLALRIGPYAGPFRGDDEVMRALVKAAQAMVAESRRQGVEPVEFEVDFDCAESRLEGYRVWVETLRRELEPLPLVITVLPSWLKRGSFAPLARAAGGFVLQVHSIARPTSATAPFELCDPVQALRYVEMAGRVAVPFRVALPSYGYLVAFGADGRFLGASAEGAPPERPGGAVLRELSADPGAMARLVRTWTGDRPGTMEGVIWYRLPVAGDRLNWRWPTYESVMAGREPEPRLSVVGKVPEPGLVEIQLRNDGAADWRGPVWVRARWPGVGQEPGGRLVGSDGIRGFSVLSAVPGHVLFTNPICRLPAGEGNLIGWVRLEGEVPIEFEVSPKTGRSE